MDFFGDRVERNAFDFGAFLDGAAFFEDLEDVPGDGLTFAVRGRSRE